ncbi:MAG TPA: 50S ribosomal protein L32 [Terriglobia bacterium]|nr:50S ribosomal protein L32 [Terriglobia bacterium]HVB28585.1 50S ribosomal protein L32 [Terriglobia bacterium]
MANPKGRHSNARRKRRRSHDHLKRHSVSECPNCHESKLPHQACPRCGQYNGREAILVKEAA